MRVVRIIKIQEGEMGGKVKHRRKDKKEAEKEEEK